MNVLRAQKRNDLVALLRAGLSFREIERRLDVRRETVGKYARVLGLREPKPAREAQVATGSTAEDTRENRPKWPPDGGASKMPQHARSACDPHREWIEKQVFLGRNAMAIYQDLVDHYGFKNRYNSVKRFVRLLRRRAPEQFDRLEYGPGEEAQVDLGTGAKTKRSGSERWSRPYLFVMTLKFSRRSFRKVVWKVDQGGWARLHEEAFRYFGGAVQYVVLDNLKQGVITPDIYDPEINPLYAAMLAHYGAVADPARVCDPDRKGTVENAIQHTQDTALKGKMFDTIEDQNAHLLDWEERWASQRIHGRAKRQVAAMFEEEKPFLKPLPVRSFRYFREELRTVADDGLIQVGQMYYAARPAMPHSRVMVRIYDLELEIYDPRRLTLLRRHPLGPRPGSVSMDPEDRIFNPSRETASLLRQAEGIGPKTRALCEGWFQQDGRRGQRRMRGVLAMAKRHDAAIIEQASRMALERGIQSSKLVGRLIESLSQKHPSQEPTLTQHHELIRDLSHYGLFFNSHAATDGYIH